MESKDLISIVIPVYNVEEYLGRCLDSVLAQTYKNTEIILVDDGSEDNSGIICDEYKENNDRIKVMHKSNGGLSDARNSGIELATGKYIVFVDSDDFVDETMVDYLYNLVQRNNAEIGICDPVHCYPNMEYKFEYQTKQICYNSEEAIKEMLYQTSFLVCACGKIYLRSVFDNIKFTKGILFEDSALMYLLFDRVDKIVYGNAKLYGYIHRENSITTNNFSRRDCDILSICNEMDEYFKNRSSITRSLSAYHISAALRIYMNAPRNGNFKKEISDCEQYINDNINDVLSDKRIRTKLRYALILYKYARFLMPYVYSRVNRWK